jgi:c-di-GMP-binding flagellar brake protein YcgR
MSWERRRDPRFECRGVASVQLATGEPPCAGKIVDLSAAGCLLVFRKRQCLPQDMHVELTFEVDHLPFRVRAQVKNVRSDTMAGFQFLGLSARVRRDLKDLVEELKENILKRIAEIKAHEDAALRKS